MHKSVVKSADFIGFDGTNLKIIKLIQFMIYNFFFANK